MMIQDHDIGAAIDKLMSVSTKGQKTAMAEEQILILKMSEDDIQNGRVTAQDGLLQKERSRLHGK